LRQCQAGSSWYIRCPSCLIIPKYNANSTQVQLISSKCWTNAGLDQNNDRTRQDAIPAATAHMQKQFFLNKINKPPPRLQVAS
jgi:hypothetical protein